MSKSGSVKVDATIKINAYSVISEAVERGVRFGYSRAHKHTDHPTDESLIDHCVDEVLGQLSELLVFPD